MAREILFRGKRLDNGVWVEGHFFQIWGRADILWGTTNGVPNMVEVAPSTVGQYTGLTDNNGKKIFEGDALRLSKGGLCVVKHGNRYRKCGFVVEYRNGAWDDVDNINSHDSVEVIGNVHDNPELMGGNEDV